MRKERRKKEFSGRVIYPFQVRNTKYKVGDNYTTDHKGSLEYLITSGKLEKPVKK